jgi:predicted acetyltransferase
MDFVELIEPRGDLESSHLSFVEEFRSAGERVVPWIADEPYASFDGYVAKLLAAAKGIGIPPGFLPHSTFWLIDERREILAISNLRHGLTQSLLRYGGHIGYGVRPSARRKGYATETLRRTLRHARDLGIAKVRLTCDKDNVASANTILRNGGQFDDEEFMPEHQRVTVRYWIDLA